jgi:hypothetical protein
MVDLRARWAILDGWCKISLFEHDGAVSQNCDEPHRSHGKQSKTVRLRR